MKYRLKTFTGIFLLLSASCEKDFTVKEQLDAQRMVVNCHFDNWNTFHVYLTQSSPLTGSAQMVSINDAHVELYLEDSLKEILPFVGTDTANSFGSYQSQLTPLPGKKYSLRITHPVYGVVTADDVVPQIPDITSFNLISFKDSVMHGSAEFSFSFNDKPGEDFYRINIWMWGQRQYVNQSGDTILESWSNGFRPQLLTNLQDTVRDNGWFILFSDKNFDGQHKEVRLQFNSMYLSAFKNLRLAVELRHVSPAHYRYYKTLQAFRDSGYNTSQPPVVYSNINNGYGIFCAEGNASMQVQVK